MSTEGCRRIVVTVPMCPHPSLSPNSRPHWRTKAKHAKELRQAARFAAVSARNTCGGGVLVGGEIHVRPVIAWSKGRRIMDGDNALASLKACFDGFTDAFLWGDDRHCVFWPVEQVRDPEGRGYVRVEITEGQS